MPIISDTVLHQGPSVYQSFHLDACVCVIRLEIDVGVVACLDGCLAGYMAVGQVLCSGHNASVVPSHLRISGARV